MNSVTYVLYSDDVDYCVLIDCGEYETLAPVLKRIGKRVQAVLLTHGHSDHIYGLNKLLVAEPSLVVGTTDDGHDEIHNSRKNLSFYHGTPFIVEGYTPLILSNRQIMNFDGIADIEVIASPGHDSSCLSYKVGNDLFTGDAYIPGVNVFSKFPRANKQQAIESRNQLMQMEKEGFRIHCGHHSFEEYIS